MSTITSKDGTEICIGDNICVPAILQSRDQRILFPELRGAPMCMPD
jgi:hypothetical protein